MNILCSKEDLTKTGVYIFKNSVNNKCYIGSTVMSFQKRMEHHVSLLRANLHKNSHFQAAWNKYGENAFNFDILEICNKSDCLCREQYYLDSILFAKDYIDKKSDNFLELGYNINPIASGTPNLSSEVIKKRSNTFKKFIGSASEFYSKFKNLEIDYDDIPSEYHSIINFWINNVPWNKGKKYESTDHLKVPKTITEKVLSARKENSKKARLKSKSILMFNSNRELIREFSCAIEVYEWSKLDNNLEIKHTGKIKDNILLAQNVAKACKTLKPYKGLYFEYKMPVDQVIDQIEQSKNGEG